MNAACRNGDHTGAKVSRTRDVIWSIADHDELFGRKPGSEMFINSLRSQRRQVAADLCEPSGIDPAEREPVARRTRVRDDLSPRIDDHRVAIRLSVLLRRAYAAFAGG